MSKGCLVLAATVRFVVTTKKHNKPVVPSAMCFANNEQNFCVSSAEL